MPQHTYLALFTAPVRADGLIDFQSPAFWQIHADGGVNFNCSEKEI
jgi:hypothetical protein